MENSLGKLSRSLINKSAKERIPLTSSFELTSRCNLRCKMCYVCEQPSNKELISQELSVAEWISLAEQARDIGVLFLTLTGGEVFIRKDFKEIYEALTNMGFILQIFTNGTLITPEIVKWIALRPPLRVSITIYGSSFETYEKLCGNGNAYNNVLRALELLREYRIPFEIKTTMVKANINDFQEITYLADKYNVRLAVSNYISQRREGDNTDPAGERLTPSELLNYNKLLFDYNKKYSEKKGITNNSDLINTHKDDEYSIKPKTSDDNALILREDDAFHCQAGKTAFWITWDGRMVPCGIIPEPYTYPLKIGMKESWRLLKIECDKIKPCDDCKNCEIKELCMMCPGKLYTETGCFDKKAPYICEYSYLVKTAIENGEI